MQDRYRHLVDGVLWYGAVDIDTQHLVIWVLLKGPESTLPEWYFPYGEYRPAGIDNELLSSIQAIRTAILECFAMNGQMRIESASGSTRRSELTG